MTDPAGTIRLWNNDAAPVFGNLAEKALGRSLFLIIPEKLRERNWKGYRHIGKCAT